MIYRLYRLFRIGHPFRWFWHRIFCIGDDHIDYLAQPGEAKHWACFYKGLNVRDAKARFFR